ncbi:reverse transcriptase domain-containing protein, partial [Tanacetum coccineum]
MNRPVNSIQNACETCGGPHANYECQTTGGYTQQDVYATMGTTNPKGALPSDTVPNPRGEIKAITTRSGIVLDGPPVRPPTSSYLKEVECELEPIMDPILTESTTRVPPLVVQSPHVSTSFEIHSPLISSSSELPKRNHHQPHIPFSSRMNKEKLQDKSDIQIHKFLQMFKKLHFNISLAKALALMPKYTKMLKDLLSNKKKLLELANTPLNENCSALMLPELIPTQMTLELANRSVSYPAGIAEDIFVPVGKFTFHADFVVVNYNVSPRVPLILGRPFLRTTHALVDVHEEELILHDGDEKIIFSFEKVFKFEKLIHHWSGNPTPSSDSMTESLFASPIPCGDSDRLLKETDTLLSHFNNYSPEYETFSFDIEENSSGSTTTHSYYSLPDYEAFYFDDDHIKEKSSGSTTTHSDFSLPEYDSFIFDLLIDPLPPADGSDFYHEEFADKLTHIISPPEYDYFYFDMEAYLGEFTRVLKEIIFDLS